MVRDRFDNLDLDTQERLGDRWLLTRWHEMTPTQREQTLNAELDAFHRLLEPRP